VGQENDDVRGRMMVHVNVGGKPCQCACHAFGIGVPDPHPISPVMACSWHQIPSLYHARVPRVTYIGLFVDAYFGTRMGKWRSVEVKRAIRAGLGRELRVDAGSLEEVQCKNELGKQFFPKVEGEVSVGGATSSNEVIFKSVNCSLCGVAAMAVWW
jgi:hypothetical protein